MKPRPAYWRQTVAVYRSLSYSGRVVPFIGMGRTDCSRVSGGATEPPAEYSEAVRAERKLDFGRNFEKGHEKPHSTTNVATACLSCHE